MSDYAWVWGLGGFLILAAGFFAGWVGRIMKGEAAGETAKVAQIKADAVAADLAAFKTEVAQQYASMKALDAVEGRVVAAIDGLGGRLDRLVEALVSQTTHRSAPRSRVGKT
jgi:hypothetical protein